MITLKEAALRCIKCTINSANFIPCITKIVDQNISRNTGTKTCATLWLLPIDFNVLPVPPYCCDQIRDSYVSMYDKTANVYCEIFFFDFLFKLLIKRNISYTLLIVDSTVFDTDVVYFSSKVYCIQRIIWYDNFILSFYDHYIQIIVPIIQQIFYSWALETKSDQYDNSSNCNYPRTKIYTPRYSVSPATLIFITQSYLVWKTYSDTP